ncbi:MAG TPA: protein-tyrosine-phosphatase [Thermodesulfobacteriota bacterium]
MHRHDPFAPYDVTVCGIPELPGYCAAGVSHVLSILDPEAPEPDAFGAFGEHARLELRFHDVIDEQDGQVAPSRDDVAALLAFGEDLLREPREDAHLLVHCHAGISRSTAALTLLLAQARPDRPAAEALAQVVRVRPPAWPNLRVVELGDALLGRRGEIVAAVRAHYRAVVAAHPEVARVMRLGGRGREVTGLDAD